MDTVPFSTVRYSILNAVTGAFLATIQEGKKTPIIFKTMLNKIIAMACHGCKENTPLKSEN